jgi:Transposase DDE domain
MLDGRVTAFRRRGLALPPAVVIADSWFSDSKLIHHVATTHQGTFLVEGKTTYVFELPDGCQVKGRDLQKPGDWPWRYSPHVPGVRYARLRAISPTYGAVTLIVVEEPGEEQYYVMCLETDISAPRLIRAWKRRRWIEHCFRTLKHLLATGACQVHGEDAYYGHLVLRLMGCLVLFYTSRTIVPPNAIRAASECPLDARSPAAGSRLTPCVARPVKFRGPRQRRRCNAP